MVWGMTPENNFPGSWIHVRAYRVTLGGMASLPFMTFLGRKNVASVVGDGGSQLILHDVCWVHPHMYPVTVTTRNMTFFAADPYKPSLTDGILGGRLDSM